MPVIPNLQIEQQITSDLSQWQHQRVSQAATIARELAPVDTGALRASIRVSEPVVIRDHVIVSLLAGGGDVDYAEEQELYGTPFLRPAMQGLDSFLERA